MKKIVFPSVIVGILGCWIWYFLLLALQENFYTINGIDTKYIVAIGMALIGAVIGYFIGRKTEKNNNSKVTMFTAIAIGAIITLLAYLLGIWLLFNVFWFLIGG